MLRGNTYKYVPQIIKKLYNISYLTQDLFDCFHNKEFEKAVLYESKLNLSGNLLDVTKVIIKNVYQFNEEIDRIITSEIEKYQLPSKYIAVHIRKGDKTNETDVLNSEKYIEYILRNFKTEDIFVFTDSYDVITELNLLYPHLNFLTLTSENEFGYFHPDFIKLSPVVRKNSIIKMFINLEIINKAQYFVGTYDSNIGMFVGMRTGGKNCFDVLNRPWMIW